jgi:hypothetical protein
MRKKILCEWKCILAGTIVRHQHPAGAAFFHAVDPVTGCSIKYLPRQGVEVLMGQYPHRGLGVEQFQEGTAFNPQGNPGS